MDYHPAASPESCGKAGALCLCREAHTVGLRWQNPVGNGKDGNDSRRVLASQMCLAFVHLTQLESPGKREASVKELPLTDWLVG